MSQHIKKSLMHLEDTVLAELLEVAQFALNDQRAVARVSSELQIPEIRVEAFAGICIELANSTGERPSVATEAELSAFVKDLSDLKAAAGQ